MSVSNGVLLAILMLSGGNVCRGHHRFGTEVVEADLGTVEMASTWTGELETEYYVLVEYTGVGIWGVPRPRKLFYFAVIVQCDPIDIRIGEKVW